MSITQVPGVRVGHAQDAKERSGVTVVVLDEPWEAVCDARGGWPGTFDADSSGRGMTFARKNAIFLSGGDIYGFDSSIGVRRYLIDKGLATRTGVGTMPATGGAVIYDLDYADVEKVDYPALAYEACAAARDGPVKEGSVGGGTGATVGKFLNGATAAKGGVGSSARVVGDVRVGAVAICNAVGNVHDPATGEPIATARRRGKAIGIDDVLGELLEGGRMRSKATTIGVVATNVPLPRDQLWRMALVAHDGLALAVRPAHMATDGDTLFGLCPAGATGPLSPDELDVVCYLATQAVAVAILRGVLAAQGKTRGPPRR